MGHFIRNLSLFGPLPDSVIVAAHMLGVEIDKRLGVWIVFILIPDLAEYSNVDSAHQLLSDDVETMCLRSAMSVLLEFPAKERRLLTDMLLHNEVLIHKSTFAFLPVIIDVVIQALAKKILLID